MDMVFRVILQVICRPLKGHKCRVARVVNNIDHWPIINFFAEEVNNMPKGRYFVYNCFKRIELLPTFQFTRIYKH